jgi:signal transduction histidine kinase
MARRVRCVIGFLTKSEQRRPLTGWMMVCDAAIAVAATVGVVIQAIPRNQPSPLPAGSVFAPMTIHGIYSGPPMYAVLSHNKMIGIVQGKLPPLVHALHGGSMSAVVLAGIALTAAPLLFRRRFPVLAWMVILAATLATRQYVPPLTFGTALFAAFCAVAYSRYRQLAIAVVLAGAIAATIALPNTLPHEAERYTALIAMMPTIAVALGMRELRRRVGDSTTRLRRAQAEHEAATIRTIERERARIAAELHDVVTHNVSVMLVQAGAARKVITSQPQDAEQALLAVEASGRTAMAELRNLLGLLCPAQDEPALDGEPARDELARDELARDGDTAGLRPQPGLAGVRALADRVSAAGLTVRLSVSGTPRDLPPGLDLAAYRVVQDGLTTVLRLAGEAGVDVLIDWGAELTITVSDDGRGPGSGTASGTEPGRGLIGLRERVAIYGGSLDTGPRPGGGWRVNARFPVERALGLRVPA